jgi:hypothetical protein
MKATQLQKNLCPQVLIMNGKLFQAMLQISIDINVNWYFFANSA